MLVRHPADEALSLPLGQRDGEPRGLGRRLARRQDHLWDAATQEAPEVETRAPAELFELEGAKLGDRLILGELAGDQASKHVPQSPARTSRMRCQCVPAQ